MYTKDEPWQTCNLMSDTTSIVFDLSLYLCRLSIEICAIAMCQSQWTSEHGPPLQECVANQRIMQSKTRGINFATSPEFGADSTSVTVYSSILASLKTCHGLPRMLGY